MDAEGGNDRPLGGESPDDDRRVEAGDDGGRVETGQRRDAESSTVVQAALQRLDGIERCQPTHDGCAEDQQVLERVHVFRAR